MAEIPDVLPGEPVESAWGNSIRDRSVQRYASASDPDLPPAPVAGDLRYLLDVDRLEIYDGTQWVRYVTQADTFDPYRIAVRQDGKNVNRTLPDGATYSLANGAGPELTIPAGWATTRLEMTAYAKGRNNESGNAIRIELLGNINGTKQQTDAEISPTRVLADYTTISTTWVREGGFSGTLFADADLRIVSAAWLLQDYWIDFEAWRLT